MKGPRTYLDWNATAPLCPEARAAMLDALDVTGNPSSVHGEGRTARRIVEDAREAVAALVGAEPSEVVFTSGATEANNWVLHGGWVTILAAGIEHDSVLAPARASGAGLVTIATRPDGQVDLAALAEQMQRLAGATGPRLLALQTANNETGVIQPVAQAARLAREHGIRVLTDAVQAMGRIACSLRVLDADYLTLSAHKLGGPKGIGALVVRDGAPIAAFITGGGQERRRRAGTENVAAIAGFGAAAKAATTGRDRYAALAALRDQMEAAVLHATPGAVVIGQAAPRLANTSCLALPGRSAETLVAGLDLAGIAVSAGAACSSGKIASSHVLAAMGLPAEIARAAIRVSIGPSTTENDIAAFLAAWTNITGWAAKAAA